MSDPIYRMHNYWLCEDSPATPLRNLYKELIETRLEPDDWDSFDALERKILGMVSDAREVINTYREKSNATNKPKD